MNKTVFPQLLNPIYGWCTLPENTNNHQNYNFTLNYIRVNKLDAMYSKSTELLSRFCIISVTVFVQSMHFSFPTLCTQKGRKIKFTRKKKKVHFAWLQPSAAGAKPQPPIVFLHTNGIIKRCTWTKCEWLKSSWVLTAKRTQQNCSDPNPKSPGEQIRNDKWIGYWKCLRKCKIVNTGVSKKKTNKKISYR